MLAYLAMFGYIHQENETPLSTAITGKQALLSFLFTFTWQLCDSKDTNGLKKCTIWKDDTAYQKYIEWLTCSWEPTQISACLTLLAEKSLIKAVLAVSSKQ